MTPTADQPTRWYGVIMYSMEVVPVMVDRETEHCIYIGPTRVKKMSAWAAYKPTLQAAHDFAVLRATDAAAGYKHRWEQSKQKECEVREARATALLPFEEGEDG